MPDLRVHCLTGDRWAIILALILSLPHLGLALGGAAGTLLLPCNALSWERMLKVLSMRVTALSLPSAFSCSCRLLASRNFQRGKCLYQTHRWCTTSRDMDQVLPMIVILLSTHDNGPTGLLLTKDAASGEMVVSPSDKSSQILHGILTLLKPCWGGSLM